MHQHYAGIPKALNISARENNHITLSALIMVVYVLQVSASLHQMMILYINS